MSDVLETFKSEDVQWKVEVVYDHDCDSPRDNDTNLGTFITWHRKYSSPDANTFTEPSDFNRWWLLVENDPRYVRVPVYMYEHSGVIYRASSGSNPFSDRWDSGMVGWIFSTPESIEITGVPLDSIESQLIEEVDYYSKWAEGECYGYVISKRKSHCDIPEHDSFDVRDSCFGFIGSIGDIDYFESVLPEDLFGQLKESHYFNE
jgi:hypothetical protein